MKRGKANAHKLPERFPPGEVLQQTQPVKRQWKLGHLLGQGGFGLIYTAFEVTDGPSTLASPYVIKVEPLDNGPLFCEFHFYQRAAKPDMSSAVLSASDWVAVEQWTQTKNLRYLGVPQFLGSGQHRKGNNQYRFLVLQRLSFDLQKLFVQKGRSFAEKSVLAVGLRMVDALEYIHDKGYCHADIKAANILLGFNNGKANFNQVYLVDYGLVSSYHVDGTHKRYREDPKRAHDGTTEYTSRDAHKGACPSRRGDMEILGYCMLEWLAGKLPWEKDLHNKDRVRNLKVQYMKDIPGLLKACFGTKPCPVGVTRYLEAVGQLAYDAMPNYHQLRQFLRSGLDNEWMLGLVGGASDARGVKRKNKPESPTTPQQRKVRPVHPPLSSKPADFPKPARPQSSGNRPPAFGNQRKASSAPKMMPSTHAPKIPGSALPVSKQTRRPFARPKTAARHCAANAGRTPPSAIPASGSGVTPSARSGRTSTKVKVCVRVPDRPSYQDPGDNYGDSDGVDEAYGQESDWTYSRETDGEYSQEVYYQDWDDVDHQEPDTLRDERDSLDWSESDSQDTDDSCPEEGESSWGCQIL